VRNIIVLACGCVSESVDGFTNEPMCGIHDCKEIVENKPDLTGRRSRCWMRHHALTDERGHGGSIAKYRYWDPDDGCWYYADKQYSPKNDNVVAWGDRVTWGEFPIETESSWELPSFRYRANKPYDQHYCGCFGWG